MGSGLRVQDLWLGVSSPAWRSMLGLRALGLAWLWQALPPPGILVDAMST